MSVVEQQLDLKQLMKEAVKEALVENSELIKEILAEVLEDIALLQRMDEGLQTEPISEAEVMELLKENS
ncbi:MAG: hypothetical protein WD851_01355 [Pirellulales bacterium]